MIWNLIAHFLARPAVAAWLIKRALRTPYTHLLRPDGTTYMERYQLFNSFPSGSNGRRPWWHFPISARVHWIRLPDIDRHDHDHPWNARTIILRGGYDEIRAGEAFQRRPGDTAALRFGEFHRITHVLPGGAWTLFISGRFRGEWGFDVDGVKIPEKLYLVKDCPNCAGSGQVCIESYPGGFLQPPEAEFATCEECFGAGKVAR